MTTPRLTLPATTRWISRHTRATPWIVAALILLFTVLQAASANAALIVAIALFLSGVPHGATERIKGGGHVTPSLYFTLIYIVFGIVVFSSWLISPIGTLTLFMLLSAWHFGKGEPFGSTFEKMTVGFWIIIGSFLLYPTETLIIFEFLTDRPGSLTSEASFNVTLYGQILAAMTLVILTLFWARNFRGNCLKPGQSARLIALIAIFLLLPPVLAVATYFFALHSLGEIADTLDQVSEKRLPWKRIAILYLPASLPALIGGTVIIVATYTGDFPLAMAAGLGIAFTVPHMLIVERLTQAAYGIPKQI